MFCQLVHPILDGHFCCLYHVSTLLSKILSVSHILRFLRITLFYKRFGFLINTKRRFKVYTLYSLQLSCTWWQLQFFGMRLYSCGLHCLSSKFQRCRRHYTGLGRSNLATITFGPNAFYATKVDICAKFCLILAYSKPKQRLLESLISAYDILFAAYRSSHFGLYNPSDTVSLYERYFCSKYKQLIKDAHVFTQSFTILVISCFSESTKMSLQYSFYFYWLVHHRRFNHCSSDVV